MPEADYSEATDNYNEIYRAALKRCGDEGEAKDIVQKTFLQAIENWDKYENGTNCRAWLYTIMRNTQINRYNKEKREPEPWDLDTYTPSSGDGWLSGRIDPPDSLEEIPDEFHWALQQLKPQFRHVVVLVCLQGFKYKEAAYILDVPVGTVMSRLHRGRETLKPLLEHRAKEMGIA